jgi:GNAT superfamily N-acetyltransferase
MPDIQAFIVDPGTPDVAICARWRAEGITVLNTSIEAETRSMEAFVADQKHQVALVAKSDGVSLGICLLVQSEIDPNHPVSPWLAGLFVAPEHRRKGVGAILVRAIEAQARLRGASRLYLYSDDAIGFYEGLGWTVLDRTMWKGFDTALMAREL